MREHDLAVLFAIGVPACLLLAGSIVVFLKGRAVSTLLQLLGASGLAIVVFTHVAETFDLLPWMHWGLKDSPGHYLDLASAVLALTLFPTGYLIHALRK